MHIGKKKINEILKTSFITEVLDEYGFTFHNDPPDTWSNERTQLWDMLSILEFKHNDLLSKTFAEKLESLLTVKQIAEHLHLSKETIYNLLKDKKIPVYKIGRQWRFKISEVDKWVIENDKPKEGVEPSAC